MTDLDPDRDLPPVTRALQLSRGERHVETEAARGRLHAYEALPAADRDLLEEARLLSALAALHQADGVYLSAVPLHERALVLTKRALGVKAAETVRCLTSVAFVYTEAGRYRDADAWARHAVATANEVFPADHPGRAGSLLTMAMISSITGDDETGERLAREVLDIRTRSLGADHVRTAQAQELVAAFYQIRGDFPQAIDGVRRARHVLETALGSAHPEVSLRTVELALCLQLGSRDADRGEIDDLSDRGGAALLEAFDANHPWLGTAATYRGRIRLVRGELDGARDEFEQALEIAEAAHGPDHLVTAVYLANLAAVLQRQGDIDGAAPMLARSLSIKTRTCGRDSRQAADAQFALALIHLAQRNDAAAIVLLTEARATRVRLVPVNHAGIAACDEGLGAAYYQLGDYATAEPFLRRALDTVESRLGPHHPELVPHLNRLGEVYRRLNHFGAARSVNGWAISIQDLAAEPDARGLAVSLNNMGLACAGLKAYREAEDAYERALALNERTDIRNRDAAIKNLKNLGSLFIESARPARAVPCFERAVTLAEEEFGTDHVAVADVSNLLGVALYSAGDFAAAETPFRRAAEMRERALGLMHTDTALSYANLGNALTKLGKRDEAEAVTLLVQTIREALALESTPL